MRRSPTYRRSLPPIVSPSKKGITKPTEKMVTIPLSVAKKRLNDIKDSVEAKIFSEIIWMSWEEFVEFRKEKKFKECIKNKSTYAFLNPWFFQSKWIWKTFVAAWIGATKRTKKMNAVYKQWLWEKLHLTREEYEELPIKKLHIKVKPYIDWAVDHVLKYISIIGPDNAENFKSSYFDKIHNKKGTLLDLLNLYVKILEDSKKSKNKNDCKMWLYEIQRIFALANLYRDMEQNHESQSSDEDRAFITNKFVELLEVRNEKKEMTKADLENHPLCSHTEKKALYIKKNEDSTYTTYPKKPADWNYDFITELQEAEILGLTQYYKSKEKSRLSSCLMRHILVRWKKWPQSTVDKFLIKKFNSFTETPDNKWLIIVIDSYNDAHVIENILTTEFWTKETSWIREMKFYLDEKVNANSSNNYIVKKWTLKISYKAKNRKNEIEELEKSIKLLEQEYKNVANSKENLPVLKKIKKDIEKQKSELKNLSHNIEIEVQIFDLQNYIKAEVDENHPAYHETYKKYQRIFDVFPKLFPTKIYWEDNQRKVITPVIDEKYEKEWEI